MKQVYILSKPPTKWSMMMRNVLVALFVVFLFIGCDRVVIPLTKNYYLVMIDVIEQMWLSYRDEKTEDQSVIQPTVYSAMWNDKYMVVKQHPCDKSTHEVNKKITNYYIVVLNMEYDFRTKKNIIGPLTLSACIKKKKELGIPDRLPHSETVKSLE